MKKWLHMMFGCKNHRIFMPDLKNEKLWKKKDR